MVRFSGAVHVALRGVRDALARLELAPGDLVLVACSGGADSLALAAATILAASQVGKSTRRNGFAIKVGAIIVNHQLQPGSMAAAAKAAEQCQHLGLDPVQIVTVEVGSQGGLEAAARDARYQALNQAADALNAQAILLGHTLDDQAESVLLGLARGSGARSLSGISPHRGRYVRPFLSVRRETTEEICRAFDLEPWHDPTNAQPIAKRNRVRLAAMPILEQVLGPGVQAALARTANQLRDDADALDIYAKQLLEQSIAAPAIRLRGDEPGVAAPRTLVDLEPEIEAGDVNQLRDVATSGECFGEDFSLNVEVLLGAPRAVRHRTLRLAALQAGASASNVTQTQVQALDALVANWRGQAAHTLPGGVKVHRDCGRLWFTK